MEYEVLYVYILLISGCITLLLLFFGDMLGLDALEEGIPFFNPVLIMCYVTFASASGFIFERLTDLNSIFILVIAMILSLALTILLNLFVLIPLKSAEVSLAYTEQSLGGQIGKVIVPIPVDGFGEIVIETINGLISKSAVGYENEFIDYDKEVLIIEVKDGVVYVKEYEKLNISF